MNAEKILEEIDKLKENCFLSEFENGYAAGAVDMANAIKDVICANMGDGKDTNVPSNGGWIPVEERLPEEGQDVLAQFVVRVVSVNGDVIEAVYIHVLYYENGVWESFAGVPNGRVEAWRPLPEPYKEKKTE